MRIAAKVFSLAIVAGTATSASAVELKNCNDINSTRDRTECLQGNFVLLNAAFETVTRELREATRTSRETEASLRKEIDDLRKIVADIKVPTPNDIKGIVDNAIVSSLKGVKIEWAAHPGVCLYFNDWTTKPERTAYTVEGCGPQDGYVFNLHK